MDSGASHNLTSDLNNLSIHSEYNGTDEVQIADGSGSGVRGEVTSSWYTSAPHTPQPNGTAERRHRLIVAMGRALLHYASLPCQFWSYAMETAAYLYNCLPSTILRGHSPFEMMFKKTPNYEKLHIFGCLCFPWLKPYSEHKLQLSSRECLFLGYAPGHSAYRCYDLVNKHMFISRNVRFDEFSFPGKSFFFNDESNLLVRARASVDNLISPVFISKVPHDKGSQKKSPTTPTFQQVTSNEITPSSLNYRCSDSWQPDQPSLPPDSSQTSSHQET
ncbi:hypothetical protein AgCh_035101 [Apium graveolens]